MTKKFEEKQKKLIEFIEKYTNKHGYSPSYREMAEAIGLKTISTINYYIKRCEEQGLVRKDNRKGRTITVCETKTTKKQKNVSQDVQYTEHLLQENAQLKEKFENLEQENKQLKQQLAEKDKEIKQLKLNYEYQKKVRAEQDKEWSERFEKVCDELERVKKSKNEGLIEVLLKDQRHQVCEEIREKMCCIYDYKNDEYLNGWNDAMHTVYDKLDQIEKGESDAKN